MKNSVDPTAEFDLFVIGAGSAGVRAARIAAGLGAKVAIAEHYRFGGTCVIRGCIPKKLLVYASQFREAFHDAVGFGFDAVEPTFSWPTLIANKDREIARLEGVYRQLLQQSAVVLVEGKARLIDRHTIDVDGRRFRAANVLIATGGWPNRPAFDGAEFGLTSNEAFELQHLPKRVVVYGGGYIAAEFAGIFNGLGSAVTMVYRGAQILRGFDDDLRAHLRAELGKKGVDCLTDTRIHRIARHTGGALSVELAGAERATTLDVDAVLLATGRLPNSAGLGLEHIGVRLDSSGAVAVDSLSRTSVANIYAVGDVTNRVALTPVAIREGAAVAMTLFGGQPTEVDYTAIPHAVFSQPPIGTVGLTQRQALAQFDSIDVYKASFRPLKATLSGSAQRSLIKLIVDSASQRVLGAHMAGVDAPEIIQGIGIAVRHGLTKQQFDQTTAIHPTAAEEFVTLRDKQTLTRADDENRSDSAAEH